MWRFVAVHNVKAVTEMWMTSRIDFIEHLFQYTKNIKHIHDLLHQIFLFHLFYINTTLHIHCSDLGDI